MQINRQQRWRLICILQAGQDSTAANVRAAIQAPVCNPRSCLPAARWAAGWPQKPQKPVIGREMGVPCPGLTPLAEASGLGKGLIQQSEGNGGRRLWQRRQAWAGGGAGNWRGLGVPCPGLTPGPEASCLGGGGASDQGKKGVPCPGKGPIRRSEGDGGRRPGRGIRPGRGQSQ
uniref:Uncharacterized protein n=1 Tax=Myotis myotis TaxID=51298 RepID=A0A7J7XHQ1_MYOMY|nr:hypothetical protein mMyoMyo1_011794 [Myotis myotis]